MEQGKAKPRARPSPIQSARALRGHPLKGDLHPAIEGDRRQGRDRARIGSKNDWRRFLRIGARTKESAKGRVSVVKNIVDKPEELNVLVQLIGGVQVRGPIERQFGVLVGAVANKILGAGDEHVGAELEFWRERNVAAKFYLLARNSRDVIAWHHEYISIRIG